MSDPTELSTPVDETDKRKQPIQRSPYFGLRFSERKVLLATIDLVIFLGTLYLTLLVIDSDSPSVGTTEKRLLWFLVLAVLWLVIGSLLNVYDLAKAASPYHSLWAAGSAALLTTAVYLFIPRITPGLPDRRLQLLLFFGLAVIGIAFWRLLYAMLFTQPAFHQTALVIGAGWSGRTLAEAVAETKDGDGNPYQGTGYRILGFIDDDPTMQGQDLDGIPVLGNHHDLMRMVYELQPDELIVAITHSQLIHEDMFRAILDCRERGIPIMRMSDLYERMTGRVPVQHAGRELHVVIPMSRPAGFRIYLAGRRLFDIFVALLGLAFLLLLIPPIWVINRLTAPGEVFYRQERVGMGGQHFQVIKFRSMVMDAEKDTGAVWASESDDRITPVGRFIRKTRLDEVPQFWNVFKGDMSLIGPRPERPEFVQELAKEIPFYRVRHAIKPGITGWAQVKYPYGASVEDSLVKLQYDLYYIKNQGPFIDFTILIKTIQVVLGFRGR